MTVALLVALLPLFALLMTVVNVLSWRRGDPTAAPRQAVSVLIPARNEEANIEQALRSLLNDPDEHFISEIIVYDDKSTDSTRRLVNAVAAEHPRVRLVAGVPLPEGWIGKPHACAQLARLAKSSLLLFMDADVQVSSGGVRRLASLLDNPGADVVTAVPRQITGSYFERLVLPLLLLTYTSWLPLRAVEWGRSPKTVAANGQMLLVRRSAYDEMGGFDAVRHEVVDDVAFCRRAKEQGLKVVFADGTKIATCRMYDGAQATIEGFSKNLHEGVGGTSGLIFTVCLYLLTFLAPYVALVLSLFMPSALGEWLFPAAAAVGMLTLQRTLIALRYQQSPFGALEHPLSILAFTFIAFNSWKWHKRGTILWAGRTYAPRNRREALESRHQLATENT